MKNKYFNTPEELIEDIRQGKTVVLVDDEDRENEGDLVLAADHVSAEKINFMAMEARGLICLALAPEQIDRLQLPQMVRDDLNYSPNKTAFTVSIEASSGVTTGISAADRAHTIRVASHPKAKPTDVHMPGHVFPIRAQQGGVLKRAGHTEGSVDLAQLAGLNPAAVICEVMNPDGSMARVPELIQFARKHQLKIGTIVDLIEFRLSRERLVEEILDASLPESYRNYKARIFRSRVDGIEHLVLQKGEIDKDKPILVRVQIDSYTKDLFQCVRQGESSLSSVLRRLDSEDSGIIVVLRGNNRTAGLSSEIKSLLEPQSRSEMDHRDYGIGAQILKALGVHRIRLLTNRLEKRVGLKAFHLEIVEVVGLLEQEEERDEKQTEKRTEECAKENGETKKEAADRDRHITLQ